jgi:hypothetical protein
VLVARGRLDRGDDLAGDAQLREGAERRLAVDAVVADGLEEADQALMDEVLALAAGEEVRAGLHAHEAAISVDQTVHRGRVTGPRPCDQSPILNLDPRLRVAPIGSATALLGCYLCT